MRDRLSCRPDPDGTLVITRAPTGTGEHLPQVVAWVYDPAYARVMAKSPELLGALQWVRTLLSQEGLCCKN